MLLFSRENVEELRKFLYHSKTHDAKIKVLNYDIENKTLALELFNVIFDIKYLFTFRGVSAVMNLEGNEYGSNHEVWYMTVEDDYSLLEEYMERYKIPKDDVTYFCIGMFSGGEMHILAKEVYVETVAKPE